MIIMDYNNKNEFNHGNKSAPQKSHFSRSPMYVEVWEQYSHHLFPDRGHKYCVGTRMN
jgi:hypothetical protein